MKHAFLLSLLLVPGLPAATALADEIHVAVAANFTAAATEIADAFAAETGDKAVLSFGSTGKLYTQIAHGAPFEVFLSADRERPEKAIEEGFAVAGTAFTYAYGALSLYSTDMTLVDPEGHVLEQPDRIRKIAIANPDTAPYGAAAVEAMKALGVYDALEPKLVQGENIAQTFQFVETGNADLGFVALSEIVGSDAGSRWDVPSGLYQPIAQDAVLLMPGKDNATAKAFLDFLNGAAAHTIIQNYGYRTELAANTR